LPSTHSSSSRNSRLWTRMWRWLKSAAARGLSSDHVEDPVDEPMVAPNAAGATPQAQQQPRLEMGKKTVPKSILVRTSGVQNFIESILFCIKTLDP